MSLRLVIATGNPGKLREFRSGLARLGADIVSAAQAGVTDLPAETGDSYEANALLKAGHAALHGELPALADDSGLEVDALDGAPGIYSARFGGVMSDGERLAYLLQQIRRVPDGARGARFVCCLALATPGGELQSFVGECRGEILQGPRGDGGFGYDPLFYSPELGKSFAEATAAEKWRVGHRGRAIRAFLAWALSPSGARALNARSPRRT